MAITTNRSFLIDRNRLTQASILIYTLFLVLSKYTYLQQYMLFASAVMSIPFFLLFLIGLYKEKRINPYILLSLVSILLSGITNLQLIYPIANIVYIGAAHHLIKRNDFLTMRYLFFWIIVSNFINFYIYTFLTPEHIGYKVIGPFVISRVSFDILYLSSASTTAMFSLIIAKRYENKPLVFLIQITSLIVIFKTGKLSVYGILLALFAIHYLISSSRFKTVESLYIYFAKSFIFLLFISSYLVYELKDNMDKTLIQLLTLRDVIWTDYYDAFFKSGKILFGNGFIPHNTTISFTNNTHSQYLMIIYVLGFFGSIIYLSCFLKLVKNTIVNVHTENGIYLKLVVCILFLMITDSYFVLSANTMYLLILMHVLLHLDDIKRQDRTSITKRPQ